MIDVLILNYNDAETTISLLNKIMNYKNIHRICVVDNKSSDNSFDLLSKYANEKICVLNSSKNGGYGYGNNFGIRYLTSNHNSEYILLCNPDVVFDDDTLLSLEMFLRTHNEYMIAAPFMLDKNSIKQPNTAFPVKSCLKYVLSTGMITSKLLKSVQYSDLVKRTDEYIDVGAVAGSMFLFDAEKMLKYGMFDENIFLYCEERVLGIKCENAGYKIALLPNISYIHNHSVSINKTFSSELAKRRIMNNSRLYVISKYYKAGLFMRTFARLFLNISILELSILSKIRNK